MSLSILMMVYPGFELLDLSGPLCAFNIASDVFGSRYEVRVSSASGGTVMSAAGVSIETRQATSRSRADTVMVIGGSCALSQDSQSDTVQLLITLARRARRSTSVCTGSFLMAAAGLLNDRRATTHWRFAPELQRKYPQVRVEPDRIYVKDGPYWTSAGITAGIDLALALIEEDYGTDVSKSVARELVVYHRRSGGQSQFSTLQSLEPASDRIKIALDFARRHLREPLPVERLAHAASLSSRQFGRLFHLETGETPARAVERLRIEFARLRIEESSESLQLIARQAGFADLQRMRRSFLRILGQSPQALRRWNRETPS